MGQFNHAYLGYRLTEDRRPADRAATEAFIGHCFAKNYGARVTAFMPRLFSLRDAQGELCGTFGLRLGSLRFFLEQYLDAPIEQAIALRCGQRVERRAVAEIGHLAGTFPGATRAIIYRLTDLLFREGSGWVVFTGTTTLRNAFFRMGLSPMDIQAAHISRLPENQRADWGRYYDYAPRVLAGNVKEGYQRLFRTPSIALQAMSGNA